MFSRGRKETKIHRILWHHLGGELLLAYGGWNVRLSVVFLHRFLVLGELIHSLVMLQSRLYALQQLRPPFSLELEETLLPYWSTHQHFPRRFPRDDQHCTSTHNKQTHISCLQLPTQTICPLFLMRPQLFIPVVLLTCFFLKKPCLSQLGM